MDESKTYILSSRAISKIGTVTAKKGINGYWFVRLGGKELALHIEEIKNLYDLVYCEDADLPTVDEENERQ